MLVWQPGRLNPHRVGVLIHEARLYADPDRAVADHDRALDSRKVECRYGTGAPGTGQAWLVLDEADLVAFDATVGLMAEQIGVLGHPGSMDVRRAHAVGILADPQQALDLLAVDPTAPDADHDPAVVAAEDLAHDTANPFRRPTPSQESAGTGEVVLLFHITDRDLLDTSVPLGCGGGRGGVPEARPGADGPPPVVAPDGREGHHPTRRRPRHHRADRCSRPARTDGGGGAVP